MKLLHRLLVVTDRHQARRPLPDVIDAALQGGARWIWLRDRDLEFAERQALALQLKALTDAAGATLTIGGDINLALRIGVSAVHLRAGDDVHVARARLGKKALIGVSAHDEADLRAALASGADYATLSPIFPTVSKPGYGPTLGTATLQRAAAMGLPIIALGGITSDHAPACMAAGAVGVAVMGEVMRAENPTIVVKLFLSNAAPSAKRSA